jgi:hypothetical protein
MVAFHNFAKAPKNKLVSTGGRFVLSISTVHSAANEFFYLENGVSSYFIFYILYLFQRRCLIFQICLENITAISINVRSSTISYTFRCQQIITYRTSGIKFCSRYSPEKKSKTCYTSHLSKILIRWKEIPMQVKLRNAVK